MSSIATPPPALVWRSKPVAWLLAGVAATALAVLSWNALTEMVSVWERREEYSYGYLIPLITLFLVWQRKNVLERMPFTGSWWGIALIAAGAVLQFLGHYAVSPLFMQYGFLLMLYGGVLSFLGGRAFRVIAVPLLILVLMIQLPNFVYQALSEQLQLISTKLGVSLVRLCNISVYVEGNIIDLGSMQLQVAEACSGLRYLFSLVTLGIIAAYFFQGALWKRILIVLLTIPISVLMNSFRIGLIGVTVEYWGKEMAEGLLHTMEGFVIFMGCTIILIGVMWLLARIGKDGRPLRSVFGLDFPEPSPKGAAFSERTVPKSFQAATGLLVGLSIAGALAQAPLHVPPVRESLAGFPLTINHWTGRSDRIDQVVLDVLKPDDYLLADYRSKNDGSLVNFHIAYFGAQTKGVSTHSPSACMPGGGWQIVKNEEHAVEGLSAAGRPLIVNRVLIQRGQATQLVYYWFKERDRLIANEHLLRWWIFWDAITRNRSDGALVRLVTPVATGEDIARADARLTAFAQEVFPKLTAYLPD